jgi:hypothetical protein
MKSLFVVSFFSVFVVFSACGGQESPTNSSNTNATNANTAVAVNSNNPLAVTTPTPEQTTNNAPTLTPVYKAYCAAMVKKDEGALRKIYSSDTIAYFEKEMKADGVKSLIEYLSDDQVTNELCEVRNEQINGDSAVAEIRSKGYPNGIKVVFVKEGGQWKLTNRSPAVPMQK